MMFRRRLGPLESLGPLLVLLCIAGCRDGRSESPPGSKWGGGKGEMRFPVETARVEARRVEYTLSAVGSVDAFERLQVTARVAGVVERVHFSEGDSVKAGDLLAEIEPQRFEVAVRQARAALEKSKAAQDDAEIGLARRVKAIAERPGLIPEEELEAFRTKARVSAAEAAQARASLELAELNLRDARVRVRMEGTLETRTVQTGQYVQPGTVLATLVRRDPLLLRFKLPESEAAPLVRGMAVRFRVRSEEKGFSATITHVAQVAEEASRMVAVVAEIDKANREPLRPGAFAEVTIPVGASDGATVIPQLAIRPTEKGFIAYVVEGGVARERVLALGMRTADGMVEVRSGIAAGEHLVIRGAEALSDGARVGTGSEGPGDGNGHGKGAKGKP
ncbi:MAG: efflux RND transporter periplasmic adaptor subunit [Deltaproteobacteria bacterium]|nr:efflux RND transporter periplasmic adaptor subunit [Deltaproteobacteria bacterium]